MLRQRRAHDCDEDRSINGAGEDPARPNEAEENNGEEVESNGVNAGQSGVDTRQQTDQDALLESGGPVEQQPLKFKVGLRFEPIEQDSSNRNQDPTSEACRTKCHWALVFVPVEKPDWSLRQELECDKHDNLTFPTRIVDGELTAHPVGIWTGFLDDVQEIIKVHPMRGTSYSAAFNNCQHWAATFLVYLQAFSATKSQRKFDVTHDERYQRVLQVLKRSGTSLYHDSNLIFHCLHMAGVGGTGAALVAAGIAADATIAVTAPAAGIAGWFGATVTTLAPAAGAGAAAAALPLLLGGGVIAAGTVVYKNLAWRKKSMFADPRIHGYPTTNPSELSAAERGQHLNGGANVATGLSASSRISGGTLIGSYAGSQVGAVAAACCNPLTAAVVAPVIAVAATSGVVLGAQKLS